jgi:hypothetical protein
MTKPKNQNRTFHLLQKPDIFICYRQTLVAEHRSKCGSDDGLLIGLQLTHSGRYSCRGPRILYRHPLLDRRFAAAKPDGARLMQPEISVATMLGYVRLREPTTLPPGRYPALEALSARAEAHPAFKACLPTPKEIGGSPQEAQAALLRLQGSAQSR